MMDHSSCRPLVGVNKTKQNKQSFKLNRTHLSNNICAALSSTRLLTNLKIQTKNLNGGFNSKFDRIIKHVK